MASTGFDPDGVWAPRGRGFSMGVVSGRGRLIHLTGQVAWDAQERIVGKGDVAEQTRQCFRNVMAVLTAVGGQASDIVSITTYYTHPDQLPAIQAVRGEFLAADAPPASTSVMVAGLGHPDFLVELTPVAVIPEERFRAPAPD